MGEVCKREGTLTSNWEEEGGRARHRVQQHQTDQGSTQSLSCSSRTARLKLQVIQLWYMFLLFFFSVVYSSNKATCTLLPHGLFLSSCIRAQVLLPPTSPSSSAAWHLFLLRAGLRTPSLTPSLSYVHFRMKLMRYQCWWQAVPGFSNADIVFIHSQPSSSTSTLQLSRSNFSNKWECFLKKT